MSAEASSQTPLVKLNSAPSDPLARFKEGMERTGGLGVRIEGRGLLHRDIGRLLPHSYPFICLSTGGGGTVIRSHTPSGAHHGTKACRPVQPHTSPPSHVCTCEFRRLDPASVGRQRSVSDARGVYTTHDERPTDRPIISIIVTAIQQRSF